MKEISNPGQNQRIETFNKKIRQYIQCTTQQDRLSMLEEINHLHRQIKASFIDNTDMSELQSINEFPGVGLELRRCGFDTRHEILADDLLIKANSCQIPLFSPEKWDAFQKNFSPKSLTDVYTQMTELIELKSTNSSQGDYSNQLMHMRQAILSTLAETENLDKITTDHLNFFLKGINFEITQSPAFKQLESQQEVMTQVVDSFLYQQLIQLSPERMNELITLLNTEHLDQTQLLKLLPGLAGFDIRPLAHGNNKIWKIVNHETGMGLVFQVGLPAENQVLINKLSSLAAKEHLSTVFFSSTVTKERPHQFILTNLYAGDLKLETEQLPTMAIDKKLETALSRLEELTSICQELSREKVAHTDIKLTNFLRDSQGHIVVADKKALIQCDTEGNLPKRIETTEFYAPPEWKTPRKQKQDTKLNAEKFTVYQLGLALYEYLILPTDSKTDRINLEFSNAIFTHSEHGKNIQEFIRAMTNPDPMKRPGLNEVKNQLHALCPSRINSQSELKENSPVQPAPLAKKLQEHYKQHIITMRKEQEDYKQKIVNKFKSLISQVKTVDELSTLRKNIEATSDYKLLTEHRGLKKLQEYFVPGNKTKSLNQINKLLHDKQIELNQQATTKALPPSRFTP